MSAFPGLPKPKNDLPVLVRTDVGCLILPVTLNPKNQKYDTQTTSQTRDDSLLNHTPRLLPRASPALRESACSLLPLSLRPSSTLGHWRSAIGCPTASAHSPSQTPSA